MKSNLSNFKCKYLCLLLCVLEYALSCLFPARGYADVMTNDNYSIDTDNISVDSILHSNTPNTIINPINPIQTKVKKSYQIEQDFANSYLSFSTDQNTLDFGSISSTDPVIRKGIFSISNNIGGYQLIAYENHQLVATTSATIPDTTCDNGSCSESTPADWSSALTYGFGYRCDNLAGTPCVNDFTTSTYYSPFSNTSLRQTGQAIMQSLTPVDQQQAEITYKVIISGTQQTGIYTNTITYLAIPNF